MSWFFEWMRLVTFLSTEGGGSLCRVSATKVDHVWHGRQEPGHCGVRSCEPISVNWEAYSHFPLWDVKIQWENRVDVVDALVKGWFGVLVCKFGDTWRSQRTVLTQCTWSSVSLIWICSPALHITSILIDLYGFMVRKVLVKPCSCLRT